MVVGEGQWCKAHWDRGVKICAGLHGPWLEILHLVLTAPGAGEAWHSVLGTPQAAGDGMVV